MCCKITSHLLWSDRAYHKSPVKSIKPNSYNAHFRQSHQLIQHSLNHITTPSLAVYHVFPALSIWSHHSAPYVFTPFPVRPSPPPCTDAFPHTGTQECFGSPITRRTPARWECRWEPRPPIGCTTHGFRLNDCTTLRPTAYTPYQARHTHGTAFFAVGRAPMWA